MYGGLQIKLEGNILSTHKTYSRIDYFLVDTKLIPFTSNPKYHSSIISDHAPLTFFLIIEGMTNKNLFWRFIPHIVNNPQGCAYLRKQMEFFFETNDTPGISPSLLWESIKAFIRGSKISYQAFQNKKNKMEQGRNNWTI